MITRYVVIGVVGAAAAIAALTAPTGSAHALDVSCVSRNNNDLARF